MTSSIVLGPRADPDSCRLGGNAYEDSLIPSLHATANNSAVRSDTQIVNQTDRVIILELTARVPVGWSLSNNLEATANPAARGKLCSGKLAEVSEATTIMRGGPAKGKRSEL